MAAGRRRCLNASSRVVVQMKDVVSGPGGTATARSPCTRDNSRRCSTPTGRTIRSPALTSSDGCTCDCAPPRNPHCCWETRSTRTCQRSTRTVDSGTGHTPVLATSSWSGCGTPTGRAARTWCAGTTGAQTSSSTGAPTATSRTPHASRSGGISTGGCSREHSPTPPCSRQHHPDMPRMCDVRLPCTIVGMPPVPHLPCAAPWPLRRQRGRRHPGPVCADSTDRVHLV